MLSRFHLIPERYGQTDGQICYINIARQYADAIKITLKACVLVCLWWATFGYGNRIRTTALIRRDVIYKIYNVVVAHLLLKTWHAG